MAAGYEIWYGYGIIITDTAVRMETFGYKSLLEKMGFEYIQRMRYCPSLQWGRIMTVAQYTDHKVVSKLLRIDHGTEAALKEWRSEARVETRGKAKATNGMILNEFNDIKTLKCPKCNRAFKRYNCIGSQNVDLRLEAYCDKNGCGVRILVDLKTKVVTMRTI